MIKKGHTQKEQKQKYQNRVAKIRTTLLNQYNLRGLFHHGKMHDL